MEFLSPFALIEKTINICRMNRFLITVFASAFALVCQAQTTRTYASRVKRATVYLQGAQLYYSEDVSIPAGTSELVFEGISPQLDQSTLFSSGRGNFMILETRFDAKYPEEVKPKAKQGGKYQKQMEVVSDSLFELGLDQTSINEPIAALLYEKKHMHKKSLIKGDVKRTKKRGHEKTKKTKEILKRSRKKHTQKKKTKEIPKRSRKKNKKKKKTKKKNKKKKKKQNKKKKNKNQ